MLTSSACAPGWRRHRFLAALKRQSLSNACPQISIETLIDLAAIDHF
jgi:hypothetical protein